MIAEFAGELIAKYIERRWPSDREEVYEILWLGLNKAWAEGRWLGMTKEFFLNVYKDEAGQNYIMGPPTHPVLLAINVFGRPTRIKEPFFMFHKNGFGDVRDTPTCKWNQDTYDLGAAPYFNKDNIIFSDGIRIGVRALGIPGVGEKVFIRGAHKDGESAYTYKNTSYGNCCGCTADPTSVSGVNGIEIPITQGFSYINNITFAEIFSISKTLTRTPVEIIAIDSFGTGHWIARMEPGQQFSNYRKYLLPNELCGLTCVHAIFKIAQQEKIASDTDPILISNAEALISLAKSIQYIYNKEQLETGAAYFMQAISTLEKEKREEESPTEAQIQVEGIYDDDLGYLKHYS